MALTDDSTSVVSPISATALPLPTGAATASAQATVITSVASIDSKNPTLGQKTMAGAVPVSIASDQSIIPVTNIPLDGSKATYSAAVVGLVFSAITTDFFSVYGSASKTVRVTRIAFSFSTTSGSGASANVSLVKRSSANIGGVSLSSAATPHDSSSPASTTTVLSYTVNPTSLGTLVGTLRAVRDSVVGSNVANNYIWDFGGRPSQAIVLRGVAQGICLSLNNSAVTGSVANMSVEWTEE